MTDALTPITPDWPAPPNVRAAMSTRSGGVSSGPYASLNLGARAGDDPAHVAENRRRLREALQLPTGPAWLHQVHGITVTGLPPSGGIGGGGDSEIQADASFTTETGVVCAVLSADCLPVLLCDDRGSVVAAVHAGWRGLEAGMIEAAVAALPAEPGRLMAWLGAAIGPRAFEVGLEVREAFVAHDPEAEHCFVGSPGNGSEGSPRYLADLYGLARQRLTLAGVRRIYGGGLCTHSDPGRFFSYRRDGVTGRMAALIWRV
jgi:polyphenol oxidase